MTTSELRTMVKRNNRELANRILEEMPEEKKQLLEKALDRNEILTSSRSLGNGCMSVYKEGWYIKLEGTRCSFSVFAKDVDGEFEFIRKPNADKLHKIYDFSCCYEFGKIK